MENQKIYTNLEELTNDLITFVKETKSPKLTSFVHEASEGVFIRLWADLGTEADPIKRIEDLSKENAALKAQADYWLKEATKNTIDPFELLKFTATKDFIAAKLASVPRTGSLTNYDIRECEGIASTLIQKLQENDNTRTANSR